MSRVARAGGVALVLAALVATPASAYPRPGVTERVSLTADGAEIGGGATSPSVSDDGRLVAFVTSADGVVPGDANNLYDVFVRDRDLGTTERVSVGDDGLGRNAMSLSPRISSDGRYVLFTSGAAFDARDTNGTWDPYIRDLEEGTTRLGVLGPDGTAVAWGVGDPHMSDDARVVTFSTGQKILPQDTNDTFDVYAYHRDTGELELVSATPSGGSGNGESYWNDVSGDGRYAVFYSFASSLVPNDTNGATDVFVRDLVADTTRRVSVASDGTEGNAASFLPDISHDGRHIAFVSYASNLVPADANPINDVFVHDRVTRRTERVSIASDGTEAGNTGLSSSWAPSISSDGRYVAFSSSASNLVPGDTNGIGDFFVHDRATGWTERVSIATDGSQMSSNNSSAAPSVGDGGFVAFTANAPNLVPGDENAAYDVFVRDRGPALGPGRLEVARSGEEISVSGWAAFSGATIAEAGDDDRDGRPPAPGVAARDLGGELVAARLTYRPEPGDLLIRWEVAELPGVAGPPTGVDLNSLVSGGVVPSVAGAPAVVYGLELSAGNTRFEVRALRVGAGAPPGAPLFALYRCAETCTEAQRLGGAFGTAGDELRAVLPLEAVGVGEGDEVSSLRAFTAMGEAPAGGLLPLDDVVLTDATVPARSVSAGIGHGPEPPQELSIPIPLSDAGFAGTFTADLPDEPRLWLRTCLGEACTLLSRPL